MRGAFVDQGGLFSYITPEARVPGNHPLMKIRELVRDLLGELKLCKTALGADSVLVCIPPFVQYCFGIAAAWNADTQHGTHGSRGTLEVTGAQSGNPKRSGHYLTVRR